MSFADLPPGSHASRVRDHWWWRPGWRVGRRYFTWHLTFEGASPLHRLVDDYQRALEGLDGVCPVPARWLHMTVQGVGFVDEVPMIELDDILYSIRRELARIRPFRLTFQRAFVGGEAIVLPPSDGNKVVELRTAIRDAIASVRGSQSVPEDPRWFRPHVSVAYLDKEGTAAPYVAAVEAPAPESAEPTVRQVSLIALDRDDRMYRWRTHAVALLGETSEDIC